MSRSKRDILDTEKMLEWLTFLLIGHHETADREWARRDAEALRRISMTLHRWHELECNADIQRFIPTRIDGKRHGDEHRCHDYSQECLSATFGHADSDTSLGSVSRDYLIKGCRRIPEAVARKLHPRLFARLDAP